MGQRIMTHTEHCDLYTSHMILELWPIIERKTGMFIFHTYPDLYDTFWHASNNNILSMLRKIDKEFCKIVKELLAEVA